MSKAISSAVFIGSLGLLYVIFGDEIGTKVQEIGGGTSISRVPHIIDGDTLIVENTKIRLEQIDTCEIGQTAKSTKLDRIDCGRWASAALRNAIGDREVTCIGKPRDRFGRLIAECTPPGGGDLGIRMVRAGVAHTYSVYSASRELKDAWAEARSLSRGVHAFDYYIAPSSYRRNK